MRHVRNENNTVLIDVANNNNLVTNYKVVIINSQDGSYWFQLGFHFRYCLSRRQLKRRKYDVIKHEKSIKYQYFSNADNDI